MLMTHRTSVTRQAVRMRRRIIGCVAFTRHMRTLGPREVAKIIKVQFEIKLCLKPVMAPEFLYWKG